MSDFNRTVDKAANALKNARDTASAEVHDVKAEAERQKRMERGETMTPGEELGSVAEEVSHKAKADYDRAKRDMRTP